MVRGELPKTANLQLRNLRSRVVVEVLPAIQENLSSCPAEKYDQKCVQYDCILGLAARFVNDQTTSWYALDSEMLVKLFP